MIPPENIISATDITSFVGFVHETFPELRSVGNGGYVTHELGFDIRFERAADEFVNYRRAYWDPVTGEFAAFFKLFDLFRLQKNVLYIFAGNAGVTATQERPLAVYSNYLSAWNCLTGQDYANSADPMTTFGVDPGFLLGEAGVYSGTNSGMSLPQFIEANGLTAVTVEAIVRPSAVGTQQQIILGSGPENATIDGERGLLLAINRPGVQGAAANVVAFKVQTTEGTTRVESEENSAPIVGQAKYLAGRWQQGSAPQLLINGLLSSVSNVPVVRGGTTVIDRGGPTCIGSFVAGAGITPDLPVPIRVIKVDNEAEFDQVLATASGVDFPANIEVDVADRSGPLRAGDRLVCKGTSTQPMVINNNKTINKTGTQANPVVIITENLFGAQIKGRWTLSGTWCVVSGFSGRGTGQGINLRGTRNRLYRNEFRAGATDPNTDAGPVHTEVSGTDGLIEFCTWDDVDVRAIKCVNDVGVTRAVRPRIWACVFKNSIPPVGGAAREAVQMGGTDGTNVPYDESGTGYQMNGLVQRCLFLNWANVNQADDENVSNKSSANIYRDLTFKNGRKLVFRHGQDCRAERILFIGGTRSRGIQIKGYNHKILESECRDGAKFQFDTGRHPQRDPDGQNPNRAYAEECTLISCLGKVEIGVVVNADAVIPATSNRLENHLSPDTLIFTKADYAWSTPLSSLDETLSTYSASPSEVTGLPLFEVTEALAGVTAAYEQAPVAF